LRASAENRPADTESPLNANLNRLLQQNLPHPASCTAAKQGTIRFGLGQLRISREIVVRPSRTGISLVAETLK
jgi:hypothetical protein